METRSLTKLYIKSPCLLAYLSHLLPRQRSWNKQVLGTLIFKSQPPLTDSWCPWGSMFQISALCDIRNTINDPLSSISWLDPSRTCWFLMHTVWIVDVLEVSCFKFQLSVTSGTPSKTPLSTISWLDPWRTWLFHLHLWIGFESYHKFAPQMFKIDPLCHQYWCFILCRDTWLINYTDCLRYLYPPGGWVGGWVGLAP